MNKYYLIKHDIESIKQHPAWVWNTARKFLKNGHRDLKKLTTGTKYIMYGYEDYEGGERLTQITGVFKVIKEAERIDEKKEKCRGWYVEGELLFNIRLPYGKREKKYYVNINPTQFFDREKYHQQLAVPLTKSEFDKIVKAIKDYSFVDHWGVMENEPTNEQGVVALFSYYCRKLGFEIKAIGTKFPDAKIILDGTEYSIEFEFNSKSYNHRKRVDYLVCWCHDWKGAENLATVVFVLRDELIKKIFSHHTRWIIQDDEGSLMNITKMDANIPYNGTSIFAHDSSVAIAPSSSLLLGAYNRRVSGFVPSAFRPNSSLRKLQIPASR
jgi:hypothetical protein